MKRALFGIGVLSLLVASLPARGQIIDFETLPDGSPVVDGMFITDQYSGAPHGVSFSLIDATPGIGPQIARVGSPRTAFQGPPVDHPCDAGDTSDGDKPQLNEPVGCFFLTDDGQLGSEWFGLRVTYTTPVLQASGALLDIDGTEAWVIRAMREDESVIQEVQIDAGDPDTGNGVATEWALDSTEQIYLIDIVPAGGNLQGFGLAFDNFSPSSIPANLAVSKTAPVGPSPIGSILSYELLVSNAGPGEAPDVVLEDVLPPGTSLVSATPDQGSCVLNGGVVTCDLGLVAVGSQVAVTIEAQVDSVFAVNRATVRSSVGDQNLGDNAAEAMTQIVCIDPTPAPAAAVVRERAQLGQNSPNPFSPQTNIRFSMARAGFADLKIYDVRGSLVRVLVATDLDPGEHEIAWDGRDGSGARLGSGAYFYKLKIDGHDVESRKAVLLK